jgi:hypothetical protein
LGRTVCGVHVSDHFSTLPVCINEQRGFAGGSVVRLPKNHPVTVSGEIHFTMDSGHELGRVVEHRSLEIPRVVSAVYTESCPDHVAAQVVQLFSKSKVGQLDDFLADFAAGVVALGISVVCFDEFTNFSFDLFDVLFEVSAVGAS